MKNLLELFCDVDDFWMAFTSWQQNRSLSTAKRVRQPHLSQSEIMTIVIHFHHARYRDFKTYYTQYVRVHLRDEFPDLVSYSRFVELMERVLLPMCVYLNQRRGKCTGISFVDTTSLKVCHNKRITRHKVFAGLAKRGKNTMGWFYGFKLHLVVNDQGELLGFKLTPGNVDDRRVVPHMTRALWGKLFGDKGYLSKKLFELLFAHDLQLITPIRKNMKNKLMPLMDKLLLRKRSLIETINDQLKNISQIEHSRHRSFSNFLVNLVAGLIAYSHQPKKPALNLTNAQLASLPVPI